MDILKKGERIGSGTYSKVYSLFGNSNKEEYVLKRNFRSSQIDNCHNVRELDILAKLKGHPFIIDIVQVCFDNPFRPEQPLTPTHGCDHKDDRIHFVLEKMEMTSKTFIRDMERTPSYYYQVNILACQLLLAIEYIHSKGITHRDIKPDNILLGNDKESHGGLILKLADFGMSKHLAQNIPSTPGCVTSWYRAPEIVMELEYDNKVDMWSVGCILYELISGYPLVSTDSNNNSTILRDIMSVLPEEQTLDWKDKDPLKINYIRPPERRSFYDRSGITSEEKEWFDSISENNTSNFFEVISSLLVINPDNRYSATKCLSMDFFEPMSEYINKVRKLYCPEPQETIISIFVCKERTWMSSMVASIVNKSEEYSWYSHRIIFQSISLFDRFLIWCDKEYHTKNRETDTVGTFFTMKKTGFYFYVCLYISYKYFVSIDSVFLSWNSFVPKTYVDFFSAEEAFVFEKKLIEEVFAFDIYNKTILEFSEYTSSEDLSLLLGRYLNFSRNINNVILSEFYQSLMVLKNER